MPECSRLAALRRRSVAAKILFAPVAQPYAQHLGHLIAFGLAQTFIERHGLLALAPAGAVVVRIPVTARHADAAAGLLDQGCAGERLGRGLFSHRDLSYSSYLRSEPRNLSGGYFSAFNAIFLSAIAARSISALSAKRMRYSRISASSSSTLARMEGSVTSSQPFCPRDH